jgi:hypothetical protein
MTKVKIIKGNTFIPSVEAAVNKWLEENPGVEVISISADGSKGKVIAICYKE